MQFECFRILAFSNLFYKVNIYYIVFSRGRIRFLGSCFLEFQMSFGG